MSLLCILWETQQWNFLSFNQISLIYKRLSFLLFFIYSNKKIKRRIHFQISMHSIPLWTDSKTPMYTLGDTAWTRSRIVAKILSAFMNLQSLSFCIFSLIRSETWRCTPSICVLSLCGLIITFHCIFREIQAGHGVKYLLRFDQLLLDYKSVLILHFFIDPNKTHDVAYVLCVLYSYVDWR